MLRFSPFVAEKFLANDRPIIVTGAGGWLGKASLEMLDMALCGEFGRRVSAYASAARTETLRSGKTIEIRPLRALADEDPKPAYILHYAYLGKEKVAQLGVERFLYENRQINDLVSGFAANVDSGGMFFASSGAAHYSLGSDQDADREPYGVAKIQDETRFLRLSSARFPVVCCRIFNMAGPFINKLDDYALSCIVRDIQSGGPIRLRASRPVLRSFVHVRDVIDLAAALMLTGAPPTAPFDTAGSEVIEIGDLARRAAQVMARPNTSIVRPSVTDLTEDRYVGKPEPFRSLLGRMGITPRPLDAQIRDTAEYIASLPLG